MIEWLRKIAFRIFKQDSFIGKVIDKVLTKEIVLYVVCGLLTTVVNLFAFWLCNRLFASIGWHGALGKLFENSRWERVVLLFSERGTEYLDSTLIAWVVGVLFAFFTNKTLVFESKSWAPGIVAREFARFVGARIFTLGVELVGMFLMVSVAAMNGYAAKVIVGIIVVVINYVFSKLLIFRSRGKTGSEAKTE